jgi:ABC-2 type transport system permease protein
VAVVDLPTAHPSSLPRPTTRMATDLLGAEWTKLRSVRSTFWTLLAAAVLTIGLGAIICAVFAAQYAHVDRQTKLDFDAASFSLTGGILAQLAIAVLGVLVITSEFGSGMIRTSFIAVPQRLHVLAAKASVFAAVTFVVTLAACAAAFTIGQAILSTKHIGVGFGSPHVLRSIIGTALYLTLLGLLALGIGSLLRKTAGAITAVVGILFVLPALSALLPSSLDPIQRFLPSNAAQSMLTGGVQPHDGTVILAPWIGLGVFGLYAVAALAGASYLLVRRDP